MGYIPSAATTTLTAKLTPIGRKKLVESVNLIKSFSLGDSDANYNTPLLLTTGQVPDVSGNLEPNSILYNGVTDNLILRSMLLMDNRGNTKKAIEKNSNFVSTEIKVNQQKIISGSSITNKIINRNDTTDSLVNLYYTFGLPLNSTDDYMFTGITTSNGGFSNTSLSGLSKTKILVMDIGANSYGGLIDGKSIKINLSTTASTYTLYSTFQDNGSSLNVQDINYIDTTLNTSYFGQNIAYLMSDEIMKPNGGDTSLTWATGYNSVKPYSLNRKKLCNITTNSNIGKTADTIVGLAYLDKGFIVITEPTIVNNFSASTTGTVITLSSVVTSVVQNVTCIANRGEFGNSTNKTFRQSDIPRITEVGLYDGDDNLIAIAKTDRQITKGVNEFFAVGVRIIV